MPTAAPESEAQEAQDPEKTNVIASSTTTSTEIGHELQIDIYSLDELENELLLLKFGISNNSASKFRINRGLTNTSESYSVSGITLIDTANQKRYLGHKESDGSCFCSFLDGAIQSGETVEMWIAYPAPLPGAESMTITTPLTPPMLDVPISKSSESIENRGLSDPEIVDLTSISDNLDDQTGRTESSDEVSIILSSDVLFETNSSELSENAQEILEQVALEVDDASSDAVNVDGYADNTGSDTINIPLSQERAEAVETVLSDLITRTGVSFEIEGHGSSDPIADNDTKEGRDRNRRVSVTFEK